MKATANLQPISAEAPQDRKVVLADALRRRILSMELAPGAVVDELALCDEFGLSRPPVRELLRQIAAEGYIELEANRAPRVAAMNHESLHSFFLAAPLIYVATTQLAALHASAAEVEVLKGIQALFRKAIEERDVENRVLYNDAFHLEIGKMAHNDYLLPSLRRILIDHTRLGKIFYRHPTTDDMQRDLELACDQHDQVIEAIERRDTETAGRVIRAHMELSRRRMAEYAAPQGMDVPLAL
ncbi:GntR family transcriptional regulator [Pseudomonas guariconensis]|uniref:GntR family transcriptional regulator n=1 Tax=Pseudomonas TaxID=286 RepID=UPI0020969AA5|nr:MULTISPECIES: GntR family transcriptional regulator [Pseudomonas]MCO7643321.1 GntR family transcriptional regulator [Pseudomonas sp. S 311-6]MCO7517703.1 GntR family transcriptional regulator [Pseudomonas putida]MCO7564640.1 GntR family transcriptional regulator [Pseudomonas mosselii]MCO7608177.1 GntR family transcriptional regulator [Pseudomonas guariconensis]MCO7619393.1 GntR family transcriptional regulator [Pseudomonas guariconensis]